MGKTRFDRNHHVKKTREKQRMTAFPLITLLLVSPQIPLHIPAQHQLRVFQRGVVNQIVECGALADGSGVLVLNSVAVDGQHGTIRILQLHAGRVDVELTTDQKLHNKSSLPSCFPLSRLPVGRRKLPENKAKSEPISNLEDMVRICLLW